MQCFVEAPVLPDIVDYVRHESKCWLKNSERLDSSSFPELWSW